MFDILFPYLGATAATAIVMVVAMLAFLRHQRAANNYERLEQNLPDACRLANIQVLREQEQEELDRLRADVSDAHVIMANKEESARWLKDNEKQLLSLQAEREHQEKLRFELARLGEDLVRDGEVHRELVRQLESTEHNVQSLKHQEVQINQTVVELQARRETLTVQVEELDGNCIPLRREWSALQAEVKNAKGELQEVREHVASSQTGLSKLQEQQSSSEARLAELVNSESLLATKVEFMVEQESQLQKEIEDLRVRKAASIDQVEKLEQRCIPLRLESSSLEAAVKHTEKDLQNIKDRCTVTRADLQAVEEKQQLSRLKLAELTSQQSTLGSSVKSLNEQESQLSKKVRDLQSRKSEIAGQIEELEQSCIPLRRELSSLRTEVKNTERDLLQIQDRFNRSFATIERQIKTAEDQRDTTRAELQSLEGNLTVGRTRLAEIEGRHSSLAADVHGLEAQKLALTEQLVLLREDWRHLRIKTGQDEDTERQRTAELWMPAIPATASSFPMVKDTDELSRLDSAANYLKGLGLQFPQRVLWAFHTSLKVTDVSPLVVLAGISGTGKSELPRRYAEAIGIHFLNVAVQPRWDSPQDMFGFFNYLENRYRATELGRALIQMDPYHAEADRGWRASDDWSQHSLARHLMIVLLDEMNLARVEYYFSEFLSRLEIRRGVNPANGQERRKAEIGLEIGSGGGDLSPIMQLFVDRNVLFVGTMNEDETTQTLSDKVVDRANVLRFGRPGRMERNPIHTNGHVRGERLAYKTWQSWCRSGEDLDSEASEQVDRWIGQLNNALMRIRRPFAFRTQLAIRAYVANYPARDPDSMLAAMADQVEQKIFPKFRGLDPRDSEVRQALQDVRAVLEELKDGLLVEAIQATAREHQFVWMGIDRFKEELIQARMS